MKISDKVYEQTKTPGYYLTSKGVIDYNLEYIGYIRGCYQRQTDLVQGDEYQIIFDVDWQGEFFECITPTQLIVLVYNRGRVDSGIEYNLNNFTYKNHQCFLKIPNNIKVMWDHDLIEKKYLLSYIMIKSVILPELSLKIHEILLESIRLDSDNYKEAIQPPITKRTKELAKTNYGFDLK